MHPFRADWNNKMVALASDWLRHFRLLLWNYWKEFNETLQEARSQHPLPSLCFSSQSKKQDGRPGLWLAETFSTSSLKPLKGIQRNLTGSKISMSSTKFVFFGPIGKKKDGCPGLWLAKTFSTSPLNMMNRIQRNLTGSKISTSTTKFVFFRRIGKQDGRPGLWLAETFSTSSLKLFNGIQRSLTGSKISTSSTKFVFFGRIGTRSPPWHLIGWDILDFFSETAELNSTKLDRKQDLNVIYQVCVFQADRKKRWPPSPLIGWDIFDFSSETTERNSTKLDRKQDLNFLYQICVFGEDRKNKMAALASDWLTHFRLILWNRWTEFNETWQEARSQHPLPSLCFSGWWEKQNGCPGLWMAETFSISSLKPLNGIQWNLTGSKISTSSIKFVFSGRWVNKNCRPGWSVKKVTHCTQVHDMWPFGPLVSFRSQIF